MVYKNGCESIMDIDHQTPQSMKRPEQSTLDRSNKLLSIQQLRFKQIQQKQEQQLETNQNHKTENINRSLFQDINSCENQQNSLSNSIFQIFNENRNNPSEECSHLFQNQIKAIRENDELIRNPDCYQFFSSINIISDQQLIDNIVFQNTKNSQQIKKTLCCNMFKHNLEMKEISLETMMNMYEQYKDEMIDYFYIEQKDCLVCFMHHNEQKLVIMNSQNTMFDKFVKNGDFYYQQLELNGLNENSMDSMELIEDKSQKCRIYIVKEQNCNYFMNCYMNYLMNMEVEFQVLSKWDFMNSQKMSGQIVQLQTLDQEKVKKTINLYDQLFRRTPNIQSLITSKNIEVKNEEGNKNGRQFYQISVEGVFFREQLEELQDYFKSEGIEIYYELNANRLSKSIQLEVVRQYYKQKNNLIL